MTGLRTVYWTAFMLMTFLVYGQARAEPVWWSPEFGGNGHYYDFVRVADPFTGTNNAWLTAKAAADASTFNGLRGHLAVITSQAENNFVFGLVTGVPTRVEGAWLGGKAPEGWLDGPETGQSFSYTNWGGIEPNNSGQAYMNIGLPSSGVAAGQWADDSGPGGSGNGDGLPNPVYDPVIGYFIEYEGGAAVPEPSS